jgi:hypothetical protein
MAPLVWERRSIAVLSALENRVLGRLIIVTTQYSAKRPWCNIKPKVALE